jgi:hypothetical protein
MNGQEQIIIIIILQSLELCYRNETRMSCKFWRYL